MVAMTLVFLNFFRIVRVFFGQYSTAVIIIALVVDLYVIPPGMIEISLLAGVIGAPCAFPRMWRRLH